ncbi:MAG: helix-turn-helix domain-containing protein [Vallitaleaceae bacterium]|jgi:methanogenic corrinoid protein MtbC1|nr:helix-turn-helix domain-containing protein [Vallitaleaceae bacterium]
MNDIAKQIKQLRKQKHMSQLEVANILGVGQSTIANYEKGIRLPNSESLKKLATLFGTSIDYIVGSVEEVRSVDVNDKRLLKLKDEFVSLLLQDEEDLAIQLIVSKAVSKVSTIKLIEKVLVEAMYEVGQLWYEGKIDVAREHFITAIVQKILGKIAYILSPEIKRDKKAICLTCYSEMHTMGIMIISEYLKAIGYKSYYLGAMSPIESVINLIKETKPEVVAISVTTPDHIEDLKLLIEALKSSTSRDDMKIIIGGQGIINPVKIVKSVGADGYAYDYKSLKALASGF